ncbi:MAG: YdiY family protein [Vicinamibacterales bacterium]
MFTRALSWLAAAAVLIGTSPAAADTLQLTNGDRLTGTIVSLAAGTLTFRTPNGSLTVPQASIAALTSDQPLLVTIGAAAPARQEPGPVPLEGLVALGPPQPAFTIDGGANAGFVATGGNTDVNSLRIDGDAVARAGANRLTLRAAINRAEDRGTPTAESWNAGVDYDRFLTRRLFVTGNSLFTHDAFRDIDLRSALGVGVGYQVADSPRVRLTANGGLGWVDENLRETANDSYTAARESARIEIFVVPTRLQIFHEHDGYFGLNGDDNRFVRTQNGVRIGLGAGLVTTLQWDIDYDRSPAPGRDRVDRAFALTFGYRF